VDAVSGVEVRFSGRLGAFELDAAFEAPGQGVTALYGPSGAGKTTLLRCIAGLERLPGRLVVKGETWQDGRRFTPPHRRAVGYVFQEPSLLPHLSVKANLLYGFRRARGRAGIAPEEVIPLLGLERLLARGVGALSGGERQRVAIGRALLSQPALLLMDEPLAGLHGQAKAEILPYLDRLHEAVAMPVIYVSHDAAEIGRLADRLVTMREGRIVGARDLGGGGDPVQSAAREVLGLADPERLRGLALAAILAGLEPQATSIDREDDV
jgi:molybdate transport system ATP-binding protein